MSCPHSKRQDGKHSWQFDGDAPRVICCFCNEMRDAISGKVIKSAKGAANENTPPPPSTFEQGYAAAIADVVAWLRKTGDWFSDIPDNERCGHGNWSWEGCEDCGIEGAADAIERGEAKGAANEDGEA